MNIRKKLSLSFFTGVLKRYFPAVVLSGIFCGIQCLILLLFAIPKQYESRAAVSMESGGDPAASSQYFVDVCSVVIKSAAVQDSLIANLDLPYTREQLNKMIFAEATDYEGVVEIAVRCENAEDAKNIANELLDISVQELNRSMTFGAAAAVSYGTLSSKPLPRTDIPVITIGVTLAGIVGSYVISAVHALLDSVVRAGDDITKRYGFPLIAEFKKVKSETRGISDVYSGIGAQNSGISEHILSEDSPDDVLKEYDSAKDALISVIPPDARKIIAVTSSNDSEGKSTVCSNMAISFANAGFKVLLIECDMISPTISKKFGISPKFGLSSVLRGICPVSDAISEGVVKNLDIMSAGRIFPNPTEMLSSDYMKTFLNASAENYNYVFLDTPSVNSSGDSQLMNEVIAGFIFVIRENTTTHADVKSAIDKIDLKNGHILGLVKTFSYT